MKGKSFGDRHAGEIKQRKKEKEDGDKNSWKTEEDHLQSLLDSMIGEDYLRRVTKQDDLSLVTHLQLQVDTSIQSLLDISDLLPALRTLTLDHSTICTLRDLGTGLRCLHTLSLAHCSLTDLDGIGVLVNLINLNLSGNNLTEINPLAMHEKLENLNLQGNLLADLELADALSSCPCLKYVQQLISNIFYPVAFIP